MDFATFIIEGHCYGTAPAPIKTVHGTLALQESVVYVCPVCGDAWARVVVPGQRFWATHIPCRKHHIYINEVPGSLWLSWDPDYNNSFPLEVMKREFELSAASIDAAALTPPN